MGRKCVKLLASMLYLIGKKYDSKHIGLYRHDRLATLTNVNRPASEKKNILAKHIKHIKTYKTY